MRKICVQCNTKFAITADDQAFYAMIEVPAPTRCPQCRMIRRMAFYNTRTLYQNQCDLCGKQILSAYAPHKPNPVYCNSCWWSDKWDATEYGRDYDFSRPFFEQFNELLREVPMMAVNCDTPTMENSDYCLNAGHLKNCYLTFHADYSENLYYCDDVVNDKDCFDCLMVEQSELCFQSVNLLNCYKAFYSVDCKDSRDIYFSKNLSGCHDCFGSVNLRNAQYCWFNEQLTKEEYEHRFAQVDLSTQESSHNIQKQAETFWLQHPVKFMHGFKNEDVTGDYIEHSKNVHEAFHTMHAENCKFTLLSVMKSSKDVYDYLSWGNNAERIYECVAVGENAYNMKFSYHTWPDCQDCEYCVHVINSSHVFGSVGLRKKQYHILNKPYSPKEYTDMVQQIKQHMIEMSYVDHLGRPYAYGEFFPSELSLFGYNETIAQSFFPLTKQEAENQGFAWYTALESLQSQAQDVIKCTHVGNCKHECKEVFRMIPQEKQFYDKMHLATPELCPNCRYHERLRFRNPAQLWERQCMCTESSHEHVGQCLVQFKTSYSQERSDIVFCELCYQKEIY